MRRTVLLAFLVSRRALLLLFAVVWLVQPVIAQDCSVTNPGTGLYDESSGASGFCPGEVPTVIIDLSHSPTATYTSCEITRKDQCNCALGSERCVEFIVTLHPDAIGFVLRKASGSQAGGNQDFIVNGDCANIGKLDEDFCITGTGPHHIAYCESGNNTHTYSIRSLTSDMSSPEVSVAEDCNAQSTVTGSVEESTATWTAVSGNASLGYLSCTSGCLDPVFTPPANIQSPYEVFTYRVCAEADASLCANSIPICTEVSFRAYPKLQVSVPDYSYCASESPWTVEATVSPGGSYYYTWYNGPTSASSVIAQGTNLSTADYAGYGGGTKYVEVTDRSFKNVSGQNCRTSGTTFTITELPTPVANIQGPAEYCPGVPVSFQADNTGIPGTTYSWTFPGGSPASATGAGPHSVTFSGCSDVTVQLVTSAAGCADQDVFTITGDDEAPSFSNPPGNQTVSCDNIPPMPDLSGSVNDNCQVGSVTGTETTNPGSCTGEYTITRTWTATDQCGNSRTHTQTIQVVDNTPPTVNPLAGGGTFSCSGDVPAPDISLVTGSDNCSSISVSHVSDTDPGNCGTTLVRTYRVTDACGNYTDVTQSFTIDDQTAPGITCPSGMTVSCMGEVPAAANSWSGFLGDGGSGMDNCQLDTDNFSLSTVVSEDCPVQITRTYTIADECGNATSCDQIITIDPPASVWVNPPGDETITCAEAMSYAVPDLSYTNQLGGVCASTGSVPGVLSGSFNECGGAWTITWTYTDPCNRTISHTQNITMEPAPAPQWVNPPGDITITCDQAVSYSIPALSYSNAESGSCLIAGSVNGVRSGSFDECGGSWTITWDYTDPCGRAISHTQNITIEPADPPEWINPPVNTTITCAEAETFVIPALDYGNANAGSCNISGSVAGMRSGTYDECGGAWTLTWNYTAPCGRTISHTQNITIEPAPEPQWNNPPSNITISCDQAASFSPVDLGYSNAGSGSCLIDGTVSPTVNTNYTTCGGTIGVLWEYTDPCGRTITHNQTVTVQPAVAPAWQGSLPANTTISCEAAATYTFPNLTYNNGSVGTCGIQGSVSPTVQENYSVCGGTIEATWTYTDPCGRTINHTQTITVEPAPAPVWQGALPANTTMSCLDAEGHAFPDLTYSNGSTGGCLLQGTVSPVVTPNYSACGGDLTAVWTYTDPCGQTIQHTQVITVEPASEPQWVNPPGDITITCDQASSYVVPDLAYSNGESGTCLIDGSVAGTRSGSYDACGGSWIINWSYTDPCGRTITHTQNITIQPAAEPQWGNPPSDITITCDEAGSYVIPDLGYSNGGSGTCLIDGSISGTRSGSYDACGGSWTINWSYTDPCGRTITHTQNITIQPAPVAQWVNPPADISITCDEAEAFVVPDLAYANGESGSCLIDGSVAGTRSGSYDACGGSWIINWAYTDPCGRTITHTQNITIQPAAEPQWVNPPSDITITCDEAGSFVIPDLAYSNGESGTCLIDGSVAGTRSGAYDACGGNWIITWSYTDPCGRNITHTQNITIQPAPVAQWVNPPADISITCDEAEVFVVPDLAYANGESGSCLIDGSVAGTRTGSYDACGGNWTINWSYTDPCGRTINHTQNITIQPADPPVWQGTLPVNTTMSCAMAQAHLFPDLTYDNGSGGTCGIQGSVSPTIQENYSVCGGTIEATWTYTDPCGRTINHTQTITVEPAPAPAWQGSLPANTTMSCLDAEGHAFPDLTYSNGSAGGCLLQGTVSPVVTPNYTSCGGDLTAVWTYTDPCGQTIQHTQVITVEPASEPQWVNPPGDITITCDQASSYVVPDLAYSNGETATCLIDGSVAGTRSGSYDACGGSWIINWSYTDPCGRTITHTQNITIQPAAEPQWGNPPSDITITCDEAGSYVIPDLGYSNGGSGTCLIDGSISGTRSGSYDACGGSWTINWSYTDPCGRTITHTQNITIQPAPVAQWVNPPADISITCDEAEAFVVPDLAYANGESGSCLIDGSVAGTRSGSYDACGGSWIINWAYTDPCGRTITHTQNITIQPAAEPQWVNPPSDITITCDEAGSYVIPDLAYSNGEGATCLIDGSVAGTRSGSYDACGGNWTINWSYTDPCGRNITHTQNSTIQPAPVAQWVNPPADISITCDEAEVFVVPDLAYANGESGSCLIDGSVAGTRTGSYDACGGNWTINWSYTDPCGRTINHTQNITIQPAPVAQWVNPPANTSITCAEAANYTVPNLTYSNAGTGGCLIEGQTPAQVTANYSACGGQILAEWIFTDDCDRTITHTQTITVEPADPPVWESVLPADITITCAEAESYVVPDLTYANASSGSCYGEGSVPGIRSGSYDVCGGSWEIEWSYTDTCGRSITHHQQITIEPSDPPEWINPPGDTVISCAEAATFNVPNLPYTNNATGGCSVDGSAPGILTGTYDECGGAWELNWTYTDPCGRTINHTQHITIEPADAPQWVDPPIDITITCAEAESYTIPELAYTNTSAGSCLIAGNVPGTRTGSFDACGGSWTISWEYTDPCGRTINHTQNITIEPTDAPQWVNPPADITITCAEADAFTIPDLTFRNNSGGTCVIAGSVPGSLTGNYDACGGGWTIDWTYTDPCGRTIAHTQQITIEPSGIPQWINPPSDTPITCSEADTYSAPELAYSNSGSGVCTILGTVPASTSGAYDACGGVRINSWSYTDPCGRTITHTQTITIEPAELPQWIDPPADTTISCEAAELFSPSDLTFTNGESSSCRLEGTATPNVWRNYTACGGVIEVHWSQSDPCGRLLEHTQLITVEPSPAAQWIAPPADVTISCAEAATYTVPDLGYTNGLTNGCLISGTVSPIVQANYSACGGRILARWTFTDNCGRTIEHVQTITVEAADPPTWQSPLPIDKTISCTEAAAYVIPDLTYANTSSGSCYGTGTVPGILSGSYDACGGAWRIQWTYTDTCGRSIDHIQHITIEPAAAPQWVDPPGDMIITCAEADSYSVPELAYTNGQASNCNISGTVSGTRTGSYDQCGGAWTVNWAFTDDCGRRITHTQSITFEPAAAPQWVDPPADRTITCAEAASYSVPELGYSNGESGTCGISGTVPGTRTGSYDQCGGSWTITWEYTDPCGTTLTHTQHITIEPAAVPQWVDPPADKTITCAEAATYSVPDLAYTNGDPTGCLISGTAPGVLLGSYDACGGNWTITWEATDACGQVISHTQQITIKPATLPQWIDPPADITITCEEAANYSVPDLSYSNGSSGTCLIDGSVAGMRTGSYDACGGNWTINWETMDDCGRIISHVQQITIEPAAATQWVDSPADTTISCREATSFTPRSLPFSNGENGTCSVEGVASPTVQSNYTACGGSIEVTWRQTDRCGRAIEHIQIITVVPADPPQWIQPPADTTISCAEAAVYVAPDLSFTNGGSGGCLDQGAVSPQVTADFDACGGQMVIQWQYTSTCGQTIEHTQTISVEPADPPAWSVPLPADRTISCAEAASYQIPDLAYANGSAGSCFTSGTVPGVRTGSYDVCGGNWTITWEYTDGCGRTIQHQQLITIEPAVAPQWVDPPADTTISCAEAATYTIPDLAYSNNAAGNCVIEGIVGGTRTGSFDQCGGSWIIEWEYTDPCGRNVQHTQLITIEPAAAPQWINPPGDMTITCAEAANYSVPDLFYSNGDSGGCQISGSVSGVRTGTFDVCGGNWTITWEYTGPCGVSLTHSQTIAIESAPPPRWIDPPAHTTIPCAEAATYTIPDLAYANGSSGLCQLSGSVSGIRTGSYDACGGSWSITWDYTDPCGRSISHSQTISIAPAPKPEWIAAPADTTLSCAAAQNYFIPDLGYSNGLHGGCAIEGSASPKITRNYDQCGGTITAEWMITDLCDSPLTHTQTITVEPVPPPAWDYLPADTVITCSEASSFSPPVLTYSNRAGDGCLIAGEAIPDVENQYTACGGHIFVRWSFTDPCGSEQTHLQRIEVQPPALPQFLNAPTERLDISCSEADAYAFPQLRVTNTEAGSCGIDQEISPTIDRSYSECGGTLTATWTYTDPCGRTVSHEQTLDVTPMPAPTWKELPTLPDEVSCSEAETLSFPDLSYQKGDPAGCFLEGTVAPVIATDFNTCGGFITVTWNHEDPCGTAITHQKSIAVRPSDSLRWVEVPPPTLVLSCDEAAAYEIPPLTYTNGISGTCSITGEVAGKRNGHYDACGGTWNIVWEYEDPCGKTLSYTQVISILPASDVYWIDPPDDLVISCDKASGYEVPPLAYSNGEQGDCKIIGWADGTLSGTTNACGGSLMAIWTYTSPCGQELTHQQEIRVLPKAPPEWINAPADTTISCAAAATYQLPTLTYSNGQSGACLVAGTIDGTQSGSYDLCGGTWENTWTYEDSCGQILQHNQTVQIEPATAPTWIDLPADSIRITCAEAEGYIFPELVYSNARSESCSINGTVSPVVSGTYNACGGQWEVTWQVTDPCGRTLQHQQVIIIEPPAMAAWIDPPVPVDTVSCFEADQLVFPDLIYTNGMTESCAIAGTVSPHILRQYDQCGGFIEITWSTLDPCGRELAFRQKLIVLPPPEPEWINPPDTLITISCADRANWSFPDLAYSNGRSGACALAGRVSPTIDSTHFSCSGELRATWEVLTPCGNKYSYQQLVRVTPPEKARWVDTPVPQQTLSCDEAEQFSFDTLFYDNGSTGTCRIAGMAIPDVVATDLGCSRSLVATWLVTDECGRSLQFRQELLIEPEAPPSWIDPLPEDTTIACVSLSEFVFPELAYGNGSTGVCGVYGQVQPQVSQFMDACGGYLIAEWTFGDSCLTSLTHQQTVTILPPPAPVWVDPPADRSITCAEASSFQVPTLAFGNQQDGQCIIAGEVEGHLTGSFTTCGGTLTIDWIYTDPCGRTITHTQELEVLPASMPVWENPPSDTTITCEQAAAFRIPDLMYTNQQEGICNLTGTVAGQRSGSYNACGGFWDIYWSTTDSCGRTLEHTQRVTILPKSMPVWYRAPTDTTLSCGAAETFSPSPLLLSNGEHGPCAVQDTIEPTWQADYDACGGTILVQWNWSDSCGRTLRHQQQVIIQPQPDPVWIDPPEDTTISCFEAEDFRIDSLSYTGPANDSCLPAGRVAPVVVRDYDACGGQLRVHWSHVSPCGKETIHKQAINVLPAPDPVVLQMPEDTFMTCSEAARFRPDTLMYSNEAGASCLLEGILVPQVTRNYDACGGQIVVSWTLESPCGLTRVIEQTVNVLPAPEPAWTHLPADTTLTYAAALSFRADPLTYANDSDQCQVTGTADPVVMGDFNVCGGILTIDWSASSICGHSLAHRQNITVLPAPAPGITLPEEHIIRCRGEAILLEPITEQVPPGGSWQWYYSPDSTVFSPLSQENEPSLRISNLTASDTGFYRLELSYSEDCSYVSGSVRLSVQGPASTFESYSICEGESISLRGEIVTQAGIYADTIVNPNGCDTIMIMEVRVIEAKETSEIRTICDGDTLRVAGQLYWEQGSYSSVYTGITGCDSIHTIHLEVLPLPRKTIQTSICAGSGYDFFGQSITKAGTYIHRLEQQQECDSLIRLELTIRPRIEELVQIAFCEGDTLEFLGRTFTESTTFAVSCQTPGGCDSLVTYQIVREPIVFLEAYDTEICLGSSVSLELSTNSEHPIHWSPARGLSCTTCASPVATPETTTTYTVSTIGCGGQVITDSLTVFVNPTPSLPEMADTSINLGDILSIGLPPSNGAVQYDWFIADEWYCTACPSVELELNSSTTITVMAYTPFGCGDTASFRVEVIPRDCQEEQILVANAITPNNDGANDFLNIQNTGQARIRSVQIFTRWGEMIFQSDTPEERWDGTIMGAPANQGVYMYLITGTCANQKESFTLNGNVTLIR